MTPPRVSFVIPAYNAQATLPETLASLQAQTYRAWEAIVVDDGSTDLTRDVAAAFVARDERVRLMRQVNAGEGAARNAALAHANADWLVFLDSDDWLLPAFLERMTSVIFASQDVGVAHCGWVAVGRDGRQGPGRFAPSNPELFPELSQHNCFAIHTCVVRRSFIGSIGPFDVGLKTCSDWDFWQRVARAGARFILVSEVLACYRLRPDSAGTQARQLLSDALTVISRGHRSDARVLHPAAPYADGMPSDRAAKAKLEMMCWAAGLSIGRGEAVEFLFNLVAEEDAAPLSPAFVSDVLFESVPIPIGELPKAWGYLWPRTEPSIDSFLAALEARMRSPGFSLLVKSLLMHKILCDALPDRLSERRLADSVGRTIIPEGFVPRSDGASATEPSPAPPYGLSRPFAERRLLEPLSHKWGYDRGQPVDRYYIERFLARHEKDVTGRVLEIGDNSYTVRYGADRVTRSDVLHVIPGNPEATLVGDLARADHIPSDAFNCIILTQTLQLVYDLPAALLTLHRVLKGGGVLLASFPGLTRSSQTEWPGSWYWRLTPASARRLFEAAFTSNGLELASHGNVLAACAFLYGLAAEELTPRELDYNDPDFDVIVTVRAVKSMPSRHGERAGTSDRPDIPFTGG